MWRKTSPLQRCVIAGGCFASQSRREGNPHSCSVARTLLSPRLPIVVTNFHISRFATSSAVTSLGRYQEQ